MAQVDFILYGVDKRTRQTFKGIIDTGFNGYLQIPMAQAFPLGLKLTGVMPSTVANGQTVISLMAEGYVSFNGGSKKIQTPVSLQNGATILVGTQLLKSLGKNIVFDFVDGTFVFKNRRRITIPTSTSASTN